MLAAVVAFCQLVAIPDAPSTPWRVDADFAQSGLSGGLPDWREASLQAARALSHEHIFSVRFEHIERFDVREGYGEIRLDQAHEDASTFYLAIGGGPDAVFRPRASVRVGATFSVSPGPILLADAAMFDYATGPTHVLKLGLEHVWFEQRLILHSQLIGSRDRNEDLHSGYAFGARWVAHERITFRATFADAPEFDGQVMADVRAASLGVWLEINADTQLRASLLQEEREVYSRTELGFGFARRF